MDLSCGSQSCKIFHIVKCVCQTGKKLINFLSLAGKKLILILSVCVLRVRDTCVHNVTKYSLVAKNFILF